jgi:hypothetical protein
MRGAQLFSQRGRLKINSSPPRYLQDGSKISRRNTKSDRDITKLFSVRTMRHLKKVEAATSFFKNRVIISANHSFVLECE